jgi:hypothetical protein
MHNSSSGTFTTVRAACGLLSCLGALACDQSVIAGGGPGVLVELGVAEQRYRVVLELLDERTSVTDVTRRHGWARQLAPIARTDKYGA